jgi:hypothetical protein
MVHAKVLQLLQKIVTENEKTEKRGRPKNTFEDYRGFISYGRRTAFGARLIPFKTKKDGMFW